MGVGPRAADDLAYRSCVDRVRCFDDRAPETSGIPSFRSFEQTTLSVRPARRTASAVSSDHNQASSCTVQRSSAFGPLDEAISFVSGYDEAAPTGPLVKYEVVIRYDNGDKIGGEFHDKATTVDYLQAFQTGNWAPAIDAHDEDVE